jgi:hypothetical protein
MLAIVEAMLRMEGGWGVDHLHIWNSWIDIWNNQKSWREAQRRCGNEAMAPPDFLTRSNSVPWKNQTPRKGQEFKSNSP